MTPETHHLFAQIVRHSKAMVTSFETWTKQQPHSKATWELGQLFAALRQMLTEIEERLVFVEVEGVEQTKEPARTR